MIFTFVQAQAFWSGRVRVDPDRRLDTPECCSYFLSIISFEFGVTYPNRLTEFWDLCPDHGQDRSGQGLDTELVHHGKIEVSHIIASLWIQSMIDWTPTDTGTSSKHAVWWPWNTPILVSEQCSIETPSGRKVSPELTVKTSYCVCFCVYTISFESPKKISRPVTRFVDIEQWGLMDVLTHPDLSWPLEMVSKTVQNSLRDCVRVSAFSSIIIWKVSNEKSDGPWPDFV